ncbi:MAG: DNA polymerase III subunit alpha [Planctomycetota bacterium]|jgi:DNA polymerase-3 subunit alpha|nr:DNA polymerase III subunit alpha [Planctomycetota bacterium]
MPAFTHLHIHTHYSPLDGIALVDRLLARGKELGQTAMAITDHGVMYGVIDFYKTAKAMGMKPLIGFEAYVAPGSRREKPQSGEAYYYHMTLLARNYTGYQNISRLCSEGFLTGFYRYPRIDKELLRQHAEGVVALSGCLRGEVPQLILGGKFAEAEQAARLYRDIFGEGHFFLEIMDNGVPEQKAILGPMRDISKRTGIPLVATADAHYLRPEDVVIQDVMICINTGRVISDTERLHAAPNCHLKSAEEMLLALPGYADAVENTQRVAELCNLDLPIGGKTFHLPSIPIPDGLKAADYLERVSREGLLARYGDPLPQRVEERLQKELRVISQMGFPDYFLIVWDVVKFARDNGIPVGPGRGSAAGSIVSYGLGITNLDPLRYNLYFERFLNEGRNEMPDIDLDFDKERRQEVVAHIINSYGAENCAKIVTFTCLSLKSGIRDVARVKGIPLLQADKLAKMVPDMFKPDNGKSPLASALELVPELKKEYTSDPLVKDWLDTVAELDGVMRNTGIHAAGVLVADRKITDYGPLCAREAEVSTQYEMKALEAMGLCKIDVLGLETLSLIKSAVATIKKSRGETLDIDHPPLDDALTYEMLSRGDSKGVFQFESDGFRQLLAGLKPDVFEDLIAAVAIYRPGPMQFIDQFINRKHGREPITYLHPLMQPILQETYGLILYQEQVQALAQDLALFSLSEGDLMRRSMGKKDAKIMEKYRQQFITGATPNIGAGVAGKVYDQIQEFAKYGFNKSHSACYAFIAFQTAYLKCHYPREYLAALLTVNRGDTDKIVFYMSDSLANGIPVLPVDINHSDTFFSVEGEAIRYGLSAIKGLGDNAGQAIEREREHGGPFQSIFDLTSRIDAKAVNRGALEALVKAGALDSLGVGRSRLAAGLDFAISHGLAEQKARASGQKGLFAMFNVAAPIPQLPEVPEWDEPQKLQFEKNVLGFYSSSHPLTAYQERIKRFATHSLKELAEAEEGTRVVVGVLLASVEKKTDKNKNRYARLILEDTEGKIEAVAFSRVYEANSGELVEDRVVFVAGEVDKSRQLSLRVSQVIPLEGAEAVLASQASLSLDMDNCDQEKLRALRDIAGRHPGTARLVFKLQSAEGGVTLMAGEMFGVRPGAALREEVGRLFGEDALVFEGRRLPEFAEPRRSFDYNRR